MGKYVTLLAVCTLLAGSAATASAQTYNVPLRGTRQPQDGYISVQSAISLILPFKEGDDYNQQQNDALKSFYRLAAGHCGLLIDTIAEGCEITALSSNTDMQTFDGRAPKLSVRGQITMSVKLKASTDKPK